MNEQTHSDITSMVARARRNCVGNAVRRSALKHRDKPALAFGDRVWSFRGLHDAAGRVARHLHDLGVIKGDRVAAYGRNSDAYLILFLACARGGFVHVPINYALTDGEVGYIVGQSEAVALFVDPALEGNLAASRALGCLRHVARFSEGQETRAILDLATDAAIDADFEAEVAEGDLLQIGYTSGTTAQPKGAAMSHQALFSEYLSCIVGLQLGPDDRHLAALPLYHTAQLHVFVMPALLIGAFTQLVAAPVAEHLLALVERAGITNLFAPPTVWIGLLRHPDCATRDLSTLRQVYYGASIMPVPVLAELRARLPGVLLFNIYGQTEIAPLATFLRPDESLARPASVGRPGLLVETRVVDVEMKDVAPGTHGEIVHRSPHLMSGYWRKPEATAEAFAGGWFHSGDVGYFDDEGYLFIVDRIKDVINTGGVLVASRDVEEALFSHPAVSEVAVIALPDPKWLEAITAVVVLRAGAAVSEAELMAHARPLLAGYKLPKRVIFTEDLPRNTAGKLLKRELRRMYGEG